MLKKIRIALATLFFVGITLLFIGIGRDWFGWMASLQLVPSIMALNFVVIAALVLLTLIFGRIYCSVICPMGVLQDCIIWIRRKVTKHKFKYVKEHKWVRYGIGVAFWVLMIIDIQAFAYLLAPYSAYGRIIRSIVGLSQGVPVWPLVVTAAATLVVILLCAWLWGREYCNTICPAGTLLSLFSRFSLLKPVIDEDKCVHCHGCEKKCKAGCIDSSSMKIDYSRCVVCGDCIGDCKVGAIRYKKPSKKVLTPQEAPSQTSESRREFIASTALILGAAATAKAETAHIKEKAVPERETPILPPGAVDARNFYGRCTACQLCISACPNKVLRPSVKLENLLQPEMQYDKGFCRPECTACSDICPSGAIHPIKEGQKLTVHIGVARVDKDACYGCGHCERKCPTGAIKMIDRHPVVNEQICIGCGACEYLCPVRPLSAIKVTGLKKQRQDGQENIS